MTPVSEGACCQGPRFISFWPLSMKRSCASCWQKKMFLMRWPFRQCVIWVILICAEKNHIFWRWGLDIYNIIPFYVDNGYNNNLVHQCCCCCWWPYRTRVTIYFKMVLKRGEMKKMTWQLLWYVAKFYESIHQIVVILSIITRIIALYLLEGK